MAAEIVLVRDDRPAEFGQRQPASPEGFETIPVVIFFESAQFIIEARHRGCRTVRQPLEQVSGRAP